MIAGRYTYPIVARQATERLQRQDYGSLGISMLEKMHSTDLQGF